MTELHIQNKEELDAFAADFLMMLKKGNEKDAGDKNMTKKPSPLSGVSQALIVGLSGDLGSGKTTFSQSIAKLLGIKDTVTSPTFIIQKSYTTTDSAFKNFVHIDAYRIEEENELEGLGFEELMKMTETLVFIEWPEKIQNGLPQDTRFLSFEFVNESERIVRY